MTRSPAARKRISGARLAETMFRSGSGLNQATDKPASLVFSARFLAVQVLVVDCAYGY